MAASAIALRAIRDSVETYEGRRAAPQRLRLTGEEQRRVRYVLSEWDGECGLGSNLGPQLEKLAQKPKHALRRTPDDFADVYAAQAWQRAWLADSQEMYVHAAAPGYRDRPCPQEAYCEKRRDERDEIILAWRALRQVPGESLAVLVALYGDLPPGMPCAGLWAAQDTEYRRVCKYAPASGGSAARLEAAVMIARGRHEGEDAAAAKARVTRALDEREAKLRLVAGECERLIVVASHDYRAARRAAS